MDSDSGSDYEIDFRLPKARPITYYRDLFLRYGLDFDGDDQIRSETIDDFELNKIYDRRVVGSEQIYFPELTDAEFESYLERIINGNLYIEINCIRFLT